MKRLKTAFFVFFMSLTFILPITASAAEVEEDHVDMFEHDCSIQLDECTDDEFIDGDYEISITSWPWTDCSNIFGHSWSDWIETGRTTSHPSYCRGYYLAIRYKRSCQRTNCSATESKTEYGMNNRTHQWVLVNQTIVNGRPMNNFKCGYNCGATSQTPA